MCYYDFAWNNYSLNLGFANSCMGATNAVSAYALANCLLLTMTAKCCYCQVENPPDRGRGVPKSPLPTATRNFTHESSPRWWGQTVQVIKSGDNPCTDCHVPKIAYVFRFVKFFLRGGQNLHRGSFYTVDCEQHATPCLPLP